MINSRKLSDLNHIVEKKANDFILTCECYKIQIIVTSTYRDYEAQALLYAQGRTSPGRKVTNARPGYSMHNHRVALDVVPLRAGKPVWGTTREDLKLWQKVGEIGKSCGLDWAGDWEKFKEYPHFQYTGGLTINDFIEGKILKA